MQTKNDNLRYLNVGFVSHTDIKQPNMTDKDKFYKVYSPQSFKLAPREDIYLDLKFDINTLPGIEPWLNLLPSLKGMGLKIEIGFQTKQKTTLFNCICLKEISIILLK